YNNEPHGTLWKDGVAINLGHLGVEDSATYTTAVAINNSGQVTGSTTNTHPYASDQAFVANESGMQALPAPPGNASYGIDINNSGAIVGVIGPFNTTDFSAVIWS